MRALRVAVVIASACGAPATAPLQGSAPAPRPIGPAPTVTWIDNGFDTTLLPAIALDGRRIVHAVRAEDGGRGHPNLALVVLGRDDRELERVVVLTAEEAEAMFDERGPVPALRARIARANRRLAELHTELALEPLAALATSADPLATDQGSHAAGSGLSVDWTANRLVVRRGTTRVVDREISASWLVKDRPMCAACAETCHNPAYLGAVHGDAERSLVLLTVSYTGTDTCWEPSSQHHVVGW